MKQSYKSFFLHNKIIIFSLTVITLLLILSGVSVYFLQSQMLTGEKKDELAAIAELRVNQLSQWNSERLADIDVIAKDQIFVSVVDNWLNDKNDTTSLNIIDNRFKLISRNYKYEDIFLLTPSGELQFAMDSNNFSSESIFIEKIFQSQTSNQSEISDFYFCPQHNKIHYDIISPISSDDNIIAYIVFRTDPSKYLYPTIQTWPTSSKTSETLLVRAEGDSLLFLNELRQMENSALKLKLPLSQKTLPSVNAALGHEGYFEGIDYDGNEVISYLSSVPNTPWFIVAKVDKQELNDTLFPQNLIVSISTFVVILSLIIGLVGFYHYSQHNYYEKLYLKEKELAESKEEFKTILFSIADAVITTDLSGNVILMNNVAEKLTGYSLDVAKGKPLQEVFNIINENSNLKVENPVDIVLREKRAVNISNHTMLFAKSGKSIPITHSGAPIKNNFGVTHGVVLVFSDRTIERERETRILESAVKYNNLFNSIRDSIIVADKNRKIIDGNPAFVDLFGYQLDELLGKDTFSVYDTLNDFEGMGEKIKANLNNPNFIHIIHYKKKNGEVFVGETNVFYLKDSEGDIIGFIGLIRDITERKSAEEKLQKQADELLKANQELNLFNKLSVGRELRMVELKEQINILSRKLGNEEQFDLSIFDENSKVNL